MTQGIVRFLVLCGAVLGGAAWGCSGGHGAGAPAVLAPSEWRTGARRVEGPLLIHTEPGDLPHLEVAGKEGQRLSLEHTHVAAKLVGFVAEVEVSQTYTNPYTEAIEAVYVFPLPENSAVNHMRMVIDRRVIEADVKERLQARRIYAQAKQEGYTAALLEQERPNVFTQSVANIEPGKKIDVVVRYTQDLSYDAGAYEFVFPMVVGPRFMPGAELERAPSGLGTKADTTRVPDASRISPPYAGKGQRTGRDISLELVADPSVAVTSFDVPTHEVVSRRPADGTLRLTLAEKASIPNRDFVLRYRVAGGEPRATLHLSGQESGYFSLQVAPPDLDVEQLVGRRELVFVVDVSGSMSGLPLSMCKTAMRDALRRMRPVDTFNILTFSGQTARAFEAPRPANLANVREALAVVDGLSAGGGTHMADAVAAALSPDVDIGRQRYVFFMTDGYVGNDDEIVAASRRFVRAVESEGGRARVFGFGVGSSVNRHLIDGLSSAGKGVAVYATAREDPIRAVNRFFHYIDRAVLENLRVDWAGMKVDELYPSPLPDLFASHPVILHGRYRGQPSGRVTVRGAAGGQSLELPVHVQAAPAALSGPGVLGALWAREKVTFLEEALGLGDTGAAEQITRLGLDFHLVTRFTSLVAVDDSRRVSDGKPNTVLEALDEPEGVDVAMAGGESAPSDGYGYEYSDDPLNDICRIDPAACPTVDVSKQSAWSELESESVYAVQQSAPRRGCGCRVAGEPNGGSAAGFTAALALCLAALRRSRRSRTRSRLE
jgi:Ca-activated chloride channel family protein